MAALAGDGSLLKNSYRLSFTRISSCLWNDTEMLCTEKETTYLICLGGLCHTRWLQWRRMSDMVSQITDSLSVCAEVCSDQHQNVDQNSVLLALWEKVKYICTHIHMCQTFILFLYVLICSCETSNNLGFVIGIKISNSFRHTARRNLENEGMISLFVLPDFSKIREMNPRQQYHFRSCIQRVNTYIRNDSHILRWDMDIFFSFFNAQFYCIFQDRRYFIYSFYLIWG